MNTNVSSPYQIFDDVGATAVDTFSSGANLPLDAPKETVQQEIARKLVVLRMLKKMAKRKKILAREMNVKKVARRKKDKTAKAARKRNRK